MNQTKTSDKIGKSVFAAAAVISIISVVVIFGFLIAESIPALNKIGFFDFLFGNKWAPDKNAAYDQPLTGSYGIAYMIAGTFAATAGALLIGGVTGFFTAVFLVYYCPKKLKRVLISIINLLAGIPSIVYGFFGLVVLVPFIREHFKNSNGQSILCASILLGIMILPTIIGASEPTIRAVEQSYYEGALALGATHERSVFTVVVPAAKSGILAAVILGVGRALGETMAVMMVVGNQPRVPNSILQGVRTLTTNIVMEMGYATDLHREALIATGVVLFAFILIINLCFSAIKRSGKE